MLEYFDHSSQLMYKRKTSRYNHRDQLSTRVGGQSIKCLWGFTHKVCTLYLQTDQALSNMHSHTFTCMFNQYQHYHMDFFTFLVWNKNCTSVLKCTKWRYANRTLWSSFCTYNSTVISDLGTKYQWNLKTDMQILITKLFHFQFHFHKVASVHLGWLLWRVDHSRNLSMDNHSNQTKWYAFS